MGYLRKHFEKEQADTLRQQDARVWADSLSRDTGFLNPKWGNYSPYSVVTLHAAVCLSVNINPDHEVVRKGWLVDVARYAHGDVGTALKTLLERYDFAVSRATKQGGDLNAGGDRCKLDLMDFAAWAQRNFIPIPAKFPGAKAQTHQAASTRATTAGEGPAKGLPPLTTGDIAPPVPVTAFAGDAEAWKAKARRRAYEIIKRDRVRDLYPSQIDIADEIAKEFRRDGMTGADGKPLAGTYIKRHALNGISSAQGKQLSTVISRGK